MCQSRWSGASGVAEGAYLDDHDELSVMLRKVNRLELGKENTARLTVYILDEVMGRW